MSTKTATPVTITAPVEQRPPPFSSDNLERKSAGTPPLPIPTKGNVTPPTPNSDYREYNNGANSGHSDTEVDPMAPQVVPMGEGQALDHAGMPVGPNQHGVIAGDRGSIEPQKFKTKLCRNYVNGTQCPFEGACAFAHGEDQLRSVQDNVVAGVTRQAISARTKQLRQQNMQAQYQMEQYANMDYGMGGPDYGHHYGIDEYGYPMPCPCLDCGMMMGASYGDYGEYGYEHAMHTAPSMDSFPSTPTFMSAPEFHPSSLPVSPGYPNSEQMPSTPSSVSVVPPTSAPVSPA